MSSAVDVVLHAAAAGCECSNSLLACSSNLVSLILSSSSEHDVLLGYCTHYLV